LPLKFLRWQPTAASGQEPTSMGAVLRRQPSKLEIAHPEREVQANLAL
jgi:hypothetical protein